MQLQIDQNGKEIKSHGTYAFPVLVSHEWLSRYERRTFLWHWHAELEWTYVVEGEICYQVNDQICRLRPGQGILCNSNVLHMGRAEQNQDCHYVSITVHPRLLEGFENSFLEQKYVRPVIGHTSCSCVMLDEANALWQRQVLGNLQRIEQLYQEKSEGFEYRIYLLLLENWFAVWKQFRNTGREPEEHTAEDRNMQRLKLIFRYLHEHYAEKITLQDVAGQVNICEAECCRLFKRYMKESLFDYLLDYRVEQSKAVLLESTVTEAAQNSGFGSPAYYTKVFKERMGCTPREYKKLAQKWQTGENGNGDDGYGTVGSDFISADGDR